MVHTCSMPARSLPLCESVNVIRSREGTKEERMTVVHDLYRFYGPPRLMRVTKSFVIVHTTLQSVTSYQMASMCSLHQWFLYAVHRQSLRFIPKHLEIEIKRNASHARLSANVCQQLPGCSSNEIGKNGCCLATSAVWQLVLFGI